MKAKILAVNSNYPQVKFMGIVTIEEKLFLRSQLTAPLSALTNLKMKILDAYFE